jgi:predicted pyridoxine 5'-phosphate oxidase superfamily flavin-nucleotide-binding protein
MKGAAGWNCLMPCARHSKRRRTVLWTCHNGVPNVVPVGHKWIVDNDLLLADFHFGKTRRNLADNPDVAISVTGPEPKQGFQLKGPATAHRDGDPYEKLVAFLQDEALTQSTGDRAPLTVCGQLCRVSIGGHQP